MADSNKKGIYGAYPIFFTHAFLLSIIGQYIPYVQAKYGLTLSYAGVIPTMQNLGSLVAVVICVAFFDLLNKPKVLALTCIGFSISIALLGINSIFSLIFVLFIIIGISSGIINTLSNAVVSDYADQKRSFYLNILHTFFGLGGAIGSQFTRIVSGVADMSMVYIFFAVYILLCGVVYMFLIKKEMKVPLVTAAWSKANLLKSLKQIKKTKGFMYVLLVSFFNGITVVNIILWTYSYLFKMSGRPIVSTLAITAYFVALLISRYFGAKLTHRILPRTFVFIGSMLGAVTYILLACLTIDPIIAIIMFGAVGLFTGNNYPQIVVESCSLAPNNTASASGLVTFSYYIAAIATPPLFGWIGDTCGLQVAHLINAIMFIPTGLLALKFRTANIGAGFLTRKRSD